MSAKIQTPFGTALPPAPHHAITVHMPAWQTITRFRDQDMELIQSLKNMYPRFVLHKDVKALTQKIVEYASVEEQGCLLFPSMQAARNCVEFATSPGRGERTVSSDQITILILNANDINLYAVFFPAASMGVLHGFWLNAGVGISSRLAEECLKHLGTLRKVSPDDIQPTMTRDSPAHVQVKMRIAELLKHAPADRQRKTVVSPDDVYLYQTGMSAIYWVHQYLLRKHGSSSVLFGFAFHSTIHVLQDFGPGAEFLGLGTREEFDELERHLLSHAERGKKIQAIWAEFPSNPLLVAPDLTRLRRLADQYGTVLVIDDTIGSFCNVDVLSVADIVVTSLTKSFSGYADVMAASAVLSPLSARYGELKKLVDDLYHNDFYPGDAEILEHNSRDYLRRSAILNNNAQRLVEYLQSQALDPSSPVKRVFYPTVSDSLANYRSYMRQTTEDFTPGYGCLFSVEFDGLDAAIAFYDNLNVHQGPHLGAHLTLAIPYCMGVYGKELEWAAKYNLQPTQIRISVGLEDTQTLLEDFKIAVQAARCGGVQN
ncbi:uncharacterized protein Z518_03899 [Rhinocladiella mackenziei CBS 650.93]|uniref:Cystathionine gamma-synthase n=1 Tax=Rhinocladiella mackenziei CBS 650.93 TaxID=1442369 RepID=A0A0D2J9Y1_9EURO|nr:uncharacterized protein Z518_03899 [Rhinocladiella mackenziei CBS 650.93]KIX05925.1 hypothetical protein Z518_03899 [Rhinocladiella mackenziei CBS 650.93]